MRMNKWNQFSQFRYISTKVMPIEKYPFPQFARHTSEVASEGLTVLYTYFCSLFNTTK